MSVNANVCGNCANFKPKQGEKFFNCTYAQQGGVKYAMQVRMDTRSCEAFSPLNKPAKPPIATQPKPAAPKRVEPRPGGLCPWGRIIMLAAIVIIILLIAFGAYTLFKGRATPAPTPTPAPTAPPTAPPTAGPTPALITPSPAPTPPPIFQYNLGSWVTAPPVLMLASSAEKVKQYSAPGPHDAPIGTSFIFVTVTVHNAGSGPIVSGATAFKIVSQSGLSFPPTELPFLIYNAYPYTPGTLAPGQIADGRIMFVVPDVVTELRLQVSTPNAIVQWILPW